MALYETKLDCLKKMKEHFSQPGASFGYEGGSCQYKTMWGHKCAVGCLIPEDKFDEAVPVMHSGGSVHSIYKSCVKAGIFPDEGAGIKDPPVYYTGGLEKYLRKCQSEHDQLAARWQHHPSVNEIDHMTFDEAMKAFLAWIDEEIEAESK